MGLSTQDLHRALHELHELRFGATDVDAAMRRIVHATHAIFCVDAAGLMLVDNEQVLRSAAVSDERFARLERLQETHSEGPCISAYDDKELVCVQDLSADPVRQRWPDFCPAALAEGMSAVLASPIPFNDAAIGVVAVLSENPRPWAPEAEIALMAFTDLAALMIAAVMQGEQQGELAKQLHSALASRAVIEQAKGIVAARDGITLRAAYETLRAQARRERRKLDAVAGEVVRAAVPGG